MSIETTDRIAPCSSMRGHKFEPRYDLSTPAIVPKSLENPVEDVIAVMEASRTKTYVLDVCVRCGATVRLFK